RGRALGLCISRRLVREAEGELDLANLPGSGEGGGGGGGARFLLWLPSARVAVPRAPVEIPQPAPPRVSPTPGLALTGIRILIVDDEELGRRPLGKCLTKRGAEIREAGDGAAAFEQLGTGRPPAVILPDLRLPKMDSAALYRR